MEVPKIIPQRRISERVVVQFDDVPVPQFQEQILEVAEVVLQERTSEHTVGVPAPQILEEIVEVVKADKIFPQNVFLLRSVNRSLTFLLEELQERILADRRYASASDGRSTR